MIPSHPPSSREPVQSPFQPRATVRLSFNTLVLMLVMVVVAGAAMLFYYALRVPAFTAELNAWLGRSEPAIDRGTARSAQLKFALFVYTAPTALGLLVYVAHWTVNKLARTSSVAREPGEDEFRME